MWTGEKKSKDSFAYKLMNYFPSTSKKIFYHELENSQDHVLHWKSNLEEQEKQEVKCVTYSHAIYAWPYSDLLGSEQQYKSALSDLPSTLPFLTIELAIKVEAKGGACKEAPPFVESFAAFLLIMLLLNFFCLLQKGYQGRSFALCLSFSSFIMSAFEGNHIQK